jgi:pimeloyl-ACP methyl ester carboxylesterase
MVETKYVQVDGVRTRYLEAGSGDLALVLIHGGGYDYRGSTTANDWSGNIGDLADRHGYHVYAIDKLGAGLTDSPRTDAGHTMGAVIDHAWRTIRALNIEECAVVGHSRGGLVAARLALDHPDVVKALTVIDSNTLAAEDPVVPADFYARPYSQPAQVHTAETVTQLTVSNAYSRRGAMDLVLAHKVDLLATPHPDRPHTTEAIERITRLTREIFLPDMTAEKYAVLDRIRGGELRVPTLIFWGLNDPSAPFKIGFDLYQLIGMSTPEAQLHVFNHAGHWMHVEHPDDFTDVLHTFLRRHWSAVTPPVAEHR